MATLVWGAKNRPPVADPPQAETRSTYFSYQKIQEMPPAFPSNPVCRYYLFVRSEHY